MVRIRSPFQFCVKLHSGFYANFMELNQSIKEWLHGHDLEFGRDWSLVMTPRYIHDIAFLRKADAMRFKLEWWDHL